METPTATSPNDDRPAQRVSIRRADLEDAAGIAECLSAAFAPYRDSYTPEAFRDTTPSVVGVQQRIRDMALLVATDSSGRIVGTIAYRVVTAGQRGHLRSMAVLPSWLGTGAAVGLIAAAEQELRGLGCQFVTLNTSRPLDRAGRFYAKCGYAATGTVGDYHGLPVFELAKTL